MVEHSKILKYGIERIPTLAEVCLTQGELSSFFSFSLMRVFK
jgi:hypothetical protein